MAVTVIKSQVDITGAAKVMPISAKYGAAIGVRIAAIYTDIAMVECGQLLQRRLRVGLVNRVNLLPFGLCDGNGLHGGYAFRTRI